MTHMDRNSFWTRATYVLLFAILFVYAIVKAKELLYPITLGILAAYLILPFVYFLEKNRIPRIIAIALSLVIIIVSFYFAGSFVYSRLEKMVSEFPNLKKQALQNIDFLILRIENSIPVGGSTLEVFLKNKITAIFESGSKVFDTIFTTTAGTIFKLLILPVYIFLFLFYRTKFAHFILMITPYNKRLITVKILRDISKIASKYLAGVIVVGIILAIINSLGLLIIGIRYAVLIGIITGLLAFIPYFGSILGGVIAFSFTLLTSPNPLIAGKVAIFYICVVFIEHNILTPNIVGNNLRINPFIIILSLIIAASIWGIPGMLVIVPFMAFVKIITKNYPSLKPYSFLLGMRGAQRHAIHFPTIKEIIQRKRIQKEEED